MQEINNKISDFVRQNGPVLPVKISKEIKSDILFASAVLAELVKQKQIFISHAKIGGSPLYYSAGQESKLQILKEYLPEREKDAFELIKKKLIIRDKTAEPWQRVALRSIKDFAIPLRVTVEENIELFWKWYLASNEEVKSLVLRVFKKKQDGLEYTGKEEKQKYERKEEKQKKLREDLEKVKKEEKYNFKDKVSSYFSEKNVKVVKEEIIKAKNIEMVINLPSEIGELRFFVKGVGKKRINDADLSLAYNKGQTKKLPVLFLTDGELTKKAKEYLEHDLKGYLVFRKI